MPKTLLVCALSVLAVIVCGCGSGSGYQTSQKTSASPAGAGIESAASPQKHIHVQRKIIYSGRAALICEDLDTAVEKLEARVKEFGGYVGDANRSGMRGAVRSASLTARVPSDRFDSFLKALPSLGELESSSRTAQDVSEEYYDVESRLRNKRVEEDRLVQLLKSATGKLAEVLEVERELSRVREEAERIEGRLRFLSNQTELSTITVTLREVKNFVPEGPPTLATKVGRSFGGSVDVLRESAVALLLFLVAILPWIVPIGLVVWVARFIVQRRNKPKPPIV